MATYNLFKFNDTKLIVNFFQMMLTVKSKDLEIDYRKRACYSQGVASKSSKLSSVNRLFVIGLMAECQENYENIKKLLEEVNLSGIAVTFSADLKLAAYLVGKQSAACIHPCVFCDGSQPWTDKCSLLTIEDLKRFHHQFMTKGEGDTDNARSFQNCVNENLLWNYPDDTLVIDVLNVPELHLLLGVVAKLLDFIQDSLIHCDLTGDKDEDAALKVYAKGSFQKVDVWNDLFPYFFCISPKCI